MLDWVIRWLVLPVIACLPMRWHGLLMRALVRLPTWQAESVAAWASAAPVLSSDVCGERHFRQQWRWVAWHDVLDAYTARVRRQPDKRVWSVSGAWPSADTCPSFIAVSTHWGAGLWSLWHLRQQGWQVSFVLENIDWSVVPCWRRWAAKIRLACVKHLGTSVVLTGGAFARLNQVLQTPRQVVVLLIDAPRPSQYTESVSLWHLTMPWPSAWHALALSTPRVLVVPFVVKVTAAGGRHLGIGAAGLPSQALPWLLNEMHGDPAAWHLWAAWQASAS